MSLKVSDHKPVSAIFKSGICFVLQYEGFEAAFLRI